MTNFGEYLMLRNIENAMYTLYYTAEGLYSIDDETLDNITKDCPDIQSLIKATSDYRRKSFGVTHEMVQDISKELCHVNRIIKDYYKNTADPHESLDTILKLNKSVYDNVIETIRQNDFSFSEENNEMVLYLFAKRLIKSVYNLVVKALTEDSDEHIDKLYLKSEDAPKLTSFIYWKVNNALNN